MEEHGGNIFDKNIRLDFSVNINPFGMPESVKKAALEGVSLAYRYPDIEKRELRKALGRKLQISPGRIVTGNGAAELIYAIAAAFEPGRAAVLGPTFGEYEKALRIHGWQVLHYLARREEGYRFTKKALEWLDKEEGLSAVFLCNPNNPTGMLADGGFLKKLADLCHRKEMLLVVDECFLELTGQGEGKSLRYLQEQYPEILILRAFTKIYAMPGLRLGYALTANEETAKRLENILPPWNVSAPAQMAGCAALEEEAFVRESREFLLKEEEWMEEKLTELGFFVWPSDTIFCMFEGEEGLQEACLKQGIYIRDAASFPGIRKGTYRIGIRQHEDNVQLLEVLKTCGDTAKRREQWQKRS